MRTKLSYDLMGETLEKDLYLKDGVILLKKGTILKKEYIDMLLDKGFVYVYIKKAE